MMRSERLEKYIKNRSLTPYKFVAIVCFFILTCQAVFFGMTELRTRAAVELIRDSGGIVATMDQVYHRSRRFDNLDQMANVVRDPYCYALAKWSVVKIPRSLSDSAEVQDAITLLGPREVILRNDDHDRNVVDVIDEILDSLPGNTQKALRGSR